tara:strand:+ start:102878 stop:103993 length:1116 start_codon:yes stop_codon:yes gene_type:complete
MSSKSPSAETIAKKVLVLNVASAFGGAEKSISILIEALKKDRGIESEDTLALVYEHKRLSELNGIQLYRFETGSLRRIRNWFSLRRKLRTLTKVVQDFAPDLIISNTYRSHLLLLLIRRQIGHAKLFVWVRDFQQPGIRWIAGFIRPQAVLVPSKAVLETYKFNVPVLVYQPLEMDLPSVNQAASEQDADESLNIVLLANLARWKGVEYAIHAAGELSKSPLRCKLDVYGNVADENYLDELKQLVQGDLQDVVTFHEFANVDEIFDGADVVFVTSVSRHGGPETYSRVVVEAFSRKIPVIAFSCGGPKYLIRDGENGFLVPEGDWKMLALRCQELAADKELRIEMGENAKSSYLRLAAESDKTFQRLFRDV